MVRKFVNWYPHWRAHDLPHYQRWVPHPVEFVRSWRIYLGPPTW